MQSVNQNNLILKGIKAAIIDMDGVITDTASVHARVWKLMFDEYLQVREKRYNEQHNPFSIESDYKDYVDGKPRYEGVKSFIESRKITLPYGNPDDQPDKETICGLGNLKNKKLHEVLEKEGVTVFQETVDQIKNWKNQGIKLALVTSSKNADIVLKKSGLANLFQIKIDGNVANVRNLKGKPHPDTFLEATKELNVNPSVSIVVEDAISGVEAGVRGKFAYVIGIGTGDSKPELLKKGAYAVVNNLKEIEIEV